MCINVRREPSDWELGVGSPVFMAAPAQSRLSVPLGWEEGASLGSNTKTLAFLRVLVDFPE